MSTEDQGREPERWGFCWLEGTISDQICHCEMVGVSLLVEVVPGSASAPRVTLLCEDHRDQYRRLWRAYLPQGEMTAEEAERLARCDS